ncbi:MAG: hydrogenase iron-sulfur subunit [Desulfobacteraceae bacterium]|nr:hydrogenase iron-sulfur subunit [Desulfobacteraceae bacterium]
MENELKIILFMCNWSPHAAFQTLQDTLAPIPREVRMVRIPCSGRITKSLLFKAFETGADGVALVGCEPGTCRYGSGTAVAERNVGATREIFKLLGLGEERLTFAAFHPDQSGPLLDFLTGFRDRIASLGKSPVQQRTRKKEPPLSPKSAASIMSAHNIYTCQDCGKCSSACPVALSGKSFSPRAIAGAIAAGELDSAPIREDIWSCLTCGLCYDRCPSAVSFPEFIRDMRTVQRASGNPRFEAHEGFFQALMRTMASPDLPVDHWHWLPPSIHTDQSSKTLFFGGCAPYFDIFFRSHLDVRTADILSDGLRLLNFFDIYPAILKNERCCGHDLLWSGDREDFLKLARLNVELISDMGIEELITACPECYRAFSHDYPANGIETGFKVTHLFEVAEKVIGKGAIGFRKLNRRITFQDPCRLSRTEGGSELPRKLLNRLKVRNFTEMRDRGPSSLCCGNCAWIGCDSSSKAMQVNRLRQAKETGSDLLLTACPKCQIHLRCAMEDPFLGDEIRMEMLDLTSVLARTIQWE